MIKPLDDIDQTISLIAAVGGSCETEVRERLRAEAKELGTNTYGQLQRQDIPLYIASEKLDAFWRDSDAFLYELTVWNTCEVKQKMRSFVSSRLSHHGFENADVFCFGDGLGFDSVWLAMQGHRVKYYEPSLRGQAYAEHVFQANNVQVSKLTSLEDIAPNSLDAVVCLDVLEHVPQPQNLVKQFHQWLRPDGVLFVHAPFWCLHWTRPTHLQENRYLSGDLNHLFHQQGFIEVDASIFWDPILLQKSDRPSPLGKTIAGRIRLRIGQLLLTMGRYNSDVHTAVARIIARPPKSWVKMLGDIVREIGGIGAQVIPAAFPIRQRRFYQPQCASTRFLRFKTTEPWASAPRLMTQQDTTFWFNSGDLQLSIFVHLIRRPQLTIAGCDQ